MHEIQVALKLTSLGEMIKVLLEIVLHSVLRKIIHVLALYIISILFDTLFKLCINACISNATLFGIEVCITNTWKYIVYKSF